MNLAGHKVNLYTLAALVLVLVAIVILHRFDTGASPMAKGTIAAMGSILLAALPKLLERIAGEGGSSSASGGGGSSAPPPAPPPAVLHRRWELLVPGAAPWLFVAAPLLLAWIVWSCTPSERAAVFTAADVACGAANVFTGASNAEVAAACRLERAAADDLCTALRDPPIDAGAIVERAGRLEEAALAVVEAVEKNADAGKDGP